MAVDLRNVLSRSLGLLALLAAQTKTTIDDEVVALLQAIHDSPALLDWFQSKLAADASGVLSIETDPPEALVEEVRERKINWARLVELLPVLLQVAKTFAG